MFSVCCDSILDRSTKFQKTLFHNRFDKDIALFFYSLFYSFKYDHESILVCSTHHLSLFSFLFIWLFHVLFAIKQNIVHSSSLVDSFGHSPHHGEQRTFLRLIDSFVADVDVFDFSSDGEETTNKFYFVSLNKSACLLI